MRNYFKFVPAFQMSFNDFYFLASVAILFDGAYFGRWPYEEYVCEIIDVQGKMSSKDFSI